MAIRLRHGHRSPLSAFMLRRTPSAANSATTLHGLDKWLYGQDNEKGGEVQLLPRHRRAL